MKVFKLESGIIKFCLVFILKKVNFGDSVEDVFAYI